LNVGGDAVVIVPDNASLSIVARVGGDISGRSIVASRSGKMINLVYGSGTAHLELTVGGDLALKGPGNPRSSSNASETGGSWNDFGHDMSNLGRELSKLGQDLSREIASAFSEAGWSSGAGIAEEIAHKAEAQARRAQRQAERQAHKAHEHASRINIRFNDREWRFDPERLERIREQARRATAEGVSGAFEAVERAMSNLRVPTPPKPPVAPIPPVPPVAPVKPVSPVAPVEPVSPVSPVEELEDVEDIEDVEGKSSARNNVSTETPPAASYDIDQEREAILRMIAEGRVTPEEGDLLLEALGS
jgi:hypothetical protein